MASFPHGIDDDIPKNQRGKTREVRAGGPFDPKRMCDDISTPAVLKKIDGFWKVVKVKDLGSATVTPIGCNTSSSAQVAPKHEPPFRKAAG